MKASPSVLALSSALVHAKVRADAPECGRHERFILDKLVLVSVVLAALPLGLAFHGLPSPAEALLFASALIPLASALLVVRTGRLAAAQVVVVGGDVAIAVLLAPLVGVAAASAWLILATIETALIRTRRLRLLACLLLILATAAVIPLAVFPLAPDASALAAICALAASASMAWRLVSAQRSDSASTMRGSRDAALVAALGDVVVFDLSGALIEGSANFTAMLNTAPDELTGRAFLDRVNVADRPAFLKLLGDAVYEGGTTFGTLRVRTAVAATTASGYSEPRHLTVEMRAHAAGRDIVTVMRDVTEMHRREAEIDAAQRSVEEVLRSKDHFLANMSHELRTPLNAIIGFSEMLGSRTMSPTEPSKQREYAGIIHQSGQHLLAVVNSILDMSKIQSGTFALIPEQFPIAPFIEQCFDVVRLQAQQGRVKIVRDVPDGLEDLVADRRACRQILTNLLSNAVKFTPEGGQVVLRVRPEGTGLRIGVSDTGIGIEEADLARLGHPFFQARSSLSRPYEGTGLGLSVVRGLVGLHGGTIVIESEVGKGTSVVVRLPLDHRHAVVSASATIETIARRGAVDMASPFERPASDTRMKKSA